MKAKELIEALSQLDPDEEIYIMDNEYGPCESDLFQLASDYNMAPIEGKNVQRWTIM